MKKKKSRSQSFSSKALQPRDQKCPTKPPGAGAELFEEVSLKFTVQYEGQKMNKTHFLCSRTDAQKGMVKIIIKDLEK